MTILGGQTPLGMGGGLGFGGLGFGMLGPSTRTPVIYKTTIMNTLVIGMHNDQSV